MPRPKCTDPEVVAARKRKKTENHTVYMRELRKEQKEEGRRIAESMTHLLEGAVANRPMPVIDTESPAGLTQHSAVAALSLSLSRNSLTVDRSLSVISKGHDSKKVRVIDGKEVSQPDTQSQLRAAELALKLFERSGGLPADRQPDVTQIRVQVLVMGEGEGQGMKTIDAEKVDE